SAPTRRCSPASSTPIRRWPCAVTPRSSAGASSPPCRRLGVMEMSRSTTMPRGPRVRPAGPSRARAARRRLVGRSAAVLAVALLVSGCTVWNDLEDHAKQEDAARPFYQVPDPLPAGKPGSLIRSLPITTAPTGSHAWRLLYHSTYLAGDDIAVSGTVVVPDGKPPAGGWPL